MAVLRTYDLNVDFSNGLHPKLLEDQIVASGHVTGFTDILLNGENLEVHGATLNDGPGLDVVISNHSFNPALEEFDESEQAKLDGIEPGAQVNVKSDWNAVSGDAEILNKPATMPPTSHTHTASDVTDFDAEVGNHIDVAANTTNRHTHSNKTILDNTTASFTTADETKLDGIEANATADQTAGEIKTAYESNANTNAFTDAEQTKLAGIETGADVTDTANVTAAGALMDSEVDADIKTLSLPANTTISTFGASLIDDIDAPTARTTLGVDAAGTDNSTNVTLGGVPNDTTDDTLDLTGQTLTVNLATVTTDGAMASTDKSKLDGIATGATANDTDANLKNRANHTGTQAASTISDFAATVRSTVLTGISFATATAITAADSILTAFGKLQAQVTINNAKVTNATHTGDVTGATALTIANNAVTYAKFQQASAGFTLLTKPTTGAGNYSELTLATDGTLGRIGSGNIVSVTPTQQTAKLNLFTAALKGLVPLSGGGTTNFLRADGTWAAPSGSRLRTINDISTDWITIFAGATLTYITNDRLYYNVTGNGSTGTLAKEYIIPADFTSFPANSFSVDIRADNIGGSAGVYVSVYKNGVVDSTLNNLLLISSTINVWEKITASFGSTYAPGDRILVKVLLQSASPSPNTLDMGMVSINYND